MFALNVSDELVPVQCGKCGIYFAMPKKFKEERLKDHRKNFYCPNGHARIFSGKTDLQKAKEQIKSLKDDLETANYRAEEIKRKFEKQQKRSAHGICPCCKRTFKQLAAHMQHKHPNFGKKLRVLKD